MKENQTLEYYNKNAEKFAKDTRSVEFTEMQDKFLSLLPSNGYILDYGCGSGRDTKYFLSRGFKVDAIDGSVELCRIASAYSGIEVKQMMFQELNIENQYDGIWACSSILHLPKSELKTVIEKMRTALKKKGYIYTSFKYGKYEGERNGRHFTDFTEAGFREFVRDISEVKIVKEWITGDARSGRSEEKWLNLILQKI
ncbi:MAG: methyltransferase domain-containing protein [Anaerosacchariphilus sp.]